MKNKTVVILTFSVLLLVGIFWVLKPTPEKNQNIQEAVEIEYDKEENKPKKIISDLMPTILDSILILKQKLLLNF